MVAKLWFTMSATVVLLFGFLFGLLAFAGYYLGLSSYVVIIIAVFLVFFQWLIGPNIIWMTTNMRLLKEGEYDWLQKSIRSICEDSGTPVPKMAIARSGSPNAFVFGRTPGSATLVVTRGLLDTLTKDEVRAVLAHEVGHIKHKDMIVMTAVSVIPVIAYYIARFTIWGRRDNERRDIGAALLVGGIAFLIYIISNLLVLALSRMREYYSDRFAGEKTKPGLLASGLAKITYGLSVREGDDLGAARSFFIADPISSSKEVSMLSSQYSDMDLTDSELSDAMGWEKKNMWVRFTEIFRTHPLTYKRILALKKLESEMRGGFGA
jgi:heat shock protein HtpX